MGLENYDKIILCGASICLGAFLGILRSKIFASKNASRLHYIFYVFSIILFILSILGPFLFWEDLQGRYFDMSILFIAIISSIALFMATNKYLLFKDTFKSSQLDPIINHFTSKADKNEIKLFGGDLNFLGNHPSEIDSNKQYTHLRSKEFRRVSILCETPTNQTQKIRYGKILTEVPGAELRFYNPEKADLRVRGRIIQLQGVNKLLMYTKIESGVYLAIETDTANSNGALYNNIWDLAWSLATKPSTQDVYNYKILFKGGN